MHESSINRMKWFIKTYLQEKREYKILDVGSYNVNGSYKHLFDEKCCFYTGLDMEAGPNVDIVPKQTYKWREIENDKYDVVISGQALEHIEFFWVTISEIVRVTKKDGIICIIAPNGFEEHRYPVDCWRFFTDGMVALARYYGLEIIHAHTNCAPNIDNENWYSERYADSMLVAKKRYGGTARIIDLENYKCKAADHKELMGTMFTYKEASELLEKEEDQKKRLTQKEYENYQKTKVSGLMLLKQKIKKKFELVIELVK